MPTTGTRSKAKSGCGTCKIRKVKCDEGFPVCHRCSSTGRICDGYGVWGGGSSFANRQTLSEPDAGPAGRGGKQVVIRPKQISLLAGSAAEKQAFDWFKCRTSAKMPGSFVAGFWTTFVLQASVSEPAVWHAVLALSAFHREGRLRSDDKSTMTAAPGGLERRVLTHLVQSIRHLQKHLTRNDGESLKVALTSCILFASLDLLRGHFPTAQNHLRNGIHLLIESGTMAKISSSDHPHPQVDSVDVWLVEALGRLQFQIALLKPSERSYSLLFRDLRSPQAVKGIFASYKQAWESLVDLFNDVFYLDQQARVQDAQYPGHPLPPELFDHQKRITTGLQSWSDVYRASGDVLKPRSTLSEKGVYDVIYAYYSMALIMAEVCLCPLDEAIYDLHADSFHRLLALMTGVRHVSSELFRFAARAEESRNYLSRSMVDLGWIPPLYFIALKCRIHRIRLQAIRLLESSLHREGIWDAKIVSQVLRKVMQMEEGSFYDGKDLCDEFGLYSSPSQQDISLPLPPGDIGCVTWRWGLKDRQPTRSFLLWP
ncbi:hypothetical protein B0I35DRAFT_478634 [Stachybotrys elegans]|uniref:Zn(2)-C6 fungal-type domain-containing protein n=1 Tax=Stachybotrys elegans TaxID=80388 RepID=A0A8K0SR33_9HYPO|nr:hypothetical protein B0I35DRAFT_478634 [Stachybotrys elegans]